ncbi:MAG: tetratricopeptide repeat protein, partial [Phycisphaerales bacterium]|nr:tetratricopeptide repeat protein [Phycisphaerales bacterium]
QRAESIAGLIYLASLYAFIRMLTTTRQDRWGWITIALCAIGMLSKEILATAPFVLLAYDAILVSDCNLIEAFKRRRRWYAPIFATIAIAVWIFLVNPRGGSAGFGNEDLPTPLEYAGTQPEIILHYLKLTFWPARLCLDYDWRVETDMASIAIPATILIAALLLVLYGAIRRRPAAFLGVWFFFILAPTSSFVPIADLAFEHRMYLPLAAIVAFVTLLAYQLAGRPEANASDNSGAMKLVATGGVIICVALGARAFERNRDYASALDMWKSVIELRPDNPRAHFNLAHSVYKLGDIRGAIAGYRDAIAIAPNYANALSQLGALLSRIGEHEEALPLLERAAIQKPKEAAIQYNLGITLSSLGRDDEAAQAYRTCLSLDPTRGDAWYNIGNIALRRKDYDAAAKAFEDAIRAQPGHIRANYNLGGIFQIRGDTRRAKERFDRAFGAAMAEGADQRSKGRLVEAVDALQLATQIRPDSAEAHFELARGLKDIGHLDAALREARTAAKLAPSMRSAADLVAELGRPAVQGATP